MLRKLRRNLAFLLFVGPLFAASIFFTVEVERHRANLARARLEGSLEDGVTIQVREALDGDEVAVTGPDGKPFVVRILGIKAFDPGARLAGISEYGTRARDHLRSFVDKEARLRFPEFRTDKSGRVLAYLEVGELDLGRDLVARGFVQTFRRYPFSRMDSYLEAQEEAVAELRGLWGSPRARARAEALETTWEALAGDV